MQVRDQFPMLRKKMHDHPLVYLDSAATTQKPQCVIDTIRRFYEEEYGTVHRAVYELAVNSTDAYEGVRRRVQHFIGAKKPEEVIFTRGTTASINLVAYAFGKAFVKPGDEVVISAMEHHSNIVPWQILCEDRGAHLRVIPMDERGVLDLNAYASLLSEKTRIVAVTHVSNALGTVNPVKEMIEMAHLAGAKVLIDGAQAIGHMPLNVGALDCDFYAFSGHKMYGPTGIGILYGKEELLDKMPPYQGGGDMIERVTFEKTTYNALPLKFEAGTPSIAGALGLGAAVDFLERLGMEKVQGWKEKLTRSLIEVLEGIEGVQLVGNAPERAGIIGFVMEGVHPLDLGTLLDLKGVAVRTGHHCCQPVMEHFGVTATTRVSLGVYNNEEDIARFAEALNGALAQHSGIWNKCPNAGLV